MVLLLTLLVFFLLRRRHQKSQQPPSGDFTSPGPAELETGKSGVQKVTDLGISGSWEKGKRPELEDRITKSAIAELSQEEHAELELRRQAVELQGQLMGVIRVAEL